MSSLPHHLNPNLNPSQNPFPLLNHASTLPNPTRSVKPSKSAVPVTIYFENFPQFWKYSDLQRAFAKYGVYGKVITARKLNKASRRFGFLTIDPTFHVNDVLSRMNTVWIGTYHIRAFISRYPFAPRVLNEKPVFAPALQDKKQIPKPVPSSFRDRRSFAQVLNPNLIIASPKHKRFQNSVIAGVSSLPNLLHACSYLRKRGITFLSSSFLGGKFILFNFNSSIEKDNFLKIDFSDFFESVIPWNSDFITHERYVWVKILGVPMAVWDEDIFCRIGNQLGSFITVHPFVNSMERMDAAYVLISTGYDRMDANLIIKVGEIMHEIFILETDSPVLMTDYSECSTSDDGSDSGESSSKSESLGHHSPPLSPSADFDLATEHSTPDWQKQPISDHDSHNSPPKSSFVPESAEIDYPALNHPSITQRRKQKVIAATGSLKSLDLTFTADTSSLKSEHIRLRNNNFLEDFEKEKMNERSMAELEKTWNIGLNTGFITVLMPSSFKCISWNCRGGLSSSRKQRIVRSMVRKNSLTFLCLIESKKESIDDFLINRLWPSLDFEYCFSPSSGASGGIICIWNKNLLSPMVVSKTKNWITLDFLWNSIPFRGIFVYASCCAIERAALWNLIKQDLATERNCFIIGDFNEILLPSDRLHCSSFSSSMRLFSEFINDSNLIESPLQGRLFTWENSVSKSKLDRCFITNGVVDIWPNSYLSALPRNFSDHVPLLFRSQVNIDWGPKPFKSINAWWEHKDFKMFVSDSWTSTSDQLNFVSKLRSLRALIKNWNLTVFGNLNHKLDSTLQAIHSLESSRDFQDLSDSDKEVLSSLHSDSYRFSKQLESLWHQKSRVNWTLLGDRNTKFFHSIASIHSRTNLMSEISVDGNLYDSPIDIKQQVTLFFKKLYKRNLTVPFSLDSLEVKKISAAQSMALTDSFSEEEILSTLMNCEDNKAPGPDGFNFFFYKRAWHIMKYDFLQLFSTFHSTGTFPPGINTAFLVLIPKIKGATNLTDFRPISLINGVFKLLSKVLANRMSLVLPHIISENQFGFIKGRNIHDCHMIASEILHIAARRKEKLFLLKLDFKKAFDSISWDFILKMLNRMGFDDTWKKWISYFFDTSQLSVLVNGSPSTNFLMGKGVRQGDPLSPMLFVLAVEGLKALISQAVNNHLLDGIRIDGYREPISILQFADDTLLFIPQDLDMIRNLLRILRCFELVSGLSINYQKSSILGINVDDETLAAASSILNCPTDTFPITYLGLPLSPKSIRANLWQPLVSKFSDQLALWKGNLLSPAGRLILIRSVLNSFPVYFMGSFAIPQAVIAVLDRCMKRFLWHGNVEGNGICKVSWESVCLPFEKGGLNLIPFKLKNQSLLCKWMWKLRSDNTSLWFFVVTTSCSISSWHELQLCNIQHLSHQWKVIHRSCIANSHLWTLFNQHVSVSMGNGKSVRFWSDNWSGESPLAARYEKLFSLSLNQSDTVHHLLSDSASDFGNSHQHFRTQFRWRRQLRIGEQEQLSSLLQETNQLLPLNSNSDTVLWRGKQFRTRDVSVLLQQSTPPCSSFMRGKLHSFAFWHWNLPPRIKFFCWLVIRDRVLSKASLVSRGIIPINLIGCTVCNISETTFHILCHCSYAWKFWSCILAKCDIVWVSPAKIDSFFELWISFCHSSHKDLWRLIWFMGIWELWKARNNRVFNDKVIPHEVLVYSCICKAVQFFSAFHPSFPYSGNDVFRCLDNFVIPL
ncbi:uncharacterized protein LOC126668506 [Mercurialis annua]|uniref:uncharacterized protein LOC126668506 n=1 Tax=Mercurialis annua TaxID=3986 RepID=UPI00215DECA4|nr:uncharacterized protein LOC126668506 [Mercurialis annua]